MGLQTATDNKETTKFNTRFGDVEYSQDAVIELPNGLLGMPNETSFFLAKMPVEKLKNFQVMQSLVDPDISFAVMPHDLLDNGLAAEDIADIAKMMEADSSDSLLTMLIASIHHTTEGAKLSVNLRAPVFINTDQKEAHQIVLPNGKYAVQHFLG